MEFRQMCKQAHLETLGKWTAEAEEGDFFPDEVLQKLNWINETFTEENSKSSHKRLAYGVFQPGEQVAIAVCELVLSDRGQLAGRWLKMLRITLSPEVELLLIEEDMDAVNLAVTAYKIAILGSFSERLHHEADTLKLYGRTEEILRFLLVLLVSINQDATSKVSASKEGRWLVVNTVK